ncbi:ABC transporter substrate-binding protein [Plantactinospora sp. GCM10030261]|uniref:ABC transporter substrate-binding protein n=1 Tax=Plantactinospora sp. GCM10030261 TaxID=3273420 RepID=UPI00360A3073
MTGRLLRGLALTSVVALLVGACTTGGSTNRGADAQGGGPVVFALSTDVDLLDPQQFRNDTAYIVTSALSGTLITEEYEETGDGTIKADGEYRSSIAEYPPTYSADRRTVTFKINQDAKFADGTPITAEDWVYTWQRIFEGPGYLSALLPLIGIESAASVRAPDPETLVVERAFDSPMFEPFMASPCCFGVMSKAAGEKQATADDPWAGKWFAQNPVSSGPLMIDSWKKGQELVMKKNPHHPDAERVRADQIVLKVVPSQEDRLALISRGAVDVTLDLALRDVQRLETNERVKVHDLDGRRVHYLGFNVASGPLADRKLREAISQAVPYSTLLEQVLFGYGQSVHSVISKGMPGYQDVFPTTQDLDAAKRLVAESGYRGESLPLAVRQSQPLDQAAATIVQDVLRQIGVTVELQTVPDSSFQEQVGQRKLPFFVMDWQSLGNDGFYQLSWVAQSDSPINYTGFANAEVDRIIKAGVPEADGAGRAQLVEQAARAFAEDMPWVPLFQPDNVVVTAAQIKSVNDFYDPLRRIEFLHRGAS